MISKERKAGTAQKNGAKSEGSADRNDKEVSSRHAKRGTKRELSLPLFVPPHSVVLANEDRQKFYRLIDAAIAQFRPEGDCELSLVRQMVEFQWKIDRNHLVESAIYHRELKRLNGGMEVAGHEMSGSPLHLGAQEVLAENATLAALRRDSAALQRQIHLLQRRLQHMQKHWPENRPPGPVRLDPAGPAKATKLIESTEEPIPFHGPYTRNGMHAFPHIFDMPAPARKRTA